MIFLLIMSLIGDEAFHAYNPYTDQDNYKTNKACMKIAIVLELILEIWFVLVIAYIAS